MNSIQEKEVRQSVRLRVMYVSEHLPYLDLLVGRPAPGEVVVIESYNHPTIEVTDLKAMVVDHLILN